jgi:16S rRNA (adenine1518-N6/adenine1519-N6)-dimethyltransferase
MSDPRPLKRFGQNYLKDHQTILKIAREFEPSLDDIVVEIGPGTGALTGELYQKVAKLYAVEIDFRVIEELSFKFPTVHFINADFLKFELSSTIQEEKKLRIVGNIPYNITSPIIFKLIENRELIKDAMMMVQLEVANRIIGTNSKKDYGILAVIINAFATTSLRFKISPNVFYPKPKVESAIIHLDFNKNLPEDISSKNFMGVVKAAFGNRRKTLKNSLSNSVYKDRVSKVEMDLTRRAEELSIDEYFELTRMLN